MTKKTYILPAIRISHIACCTILASSQTEKLRMTNGQNIITNEATDDWGNSVRRDNSSLWED